MRRIALGCLSGLAACLLFSSAVLAGSHNPADFPLRVHIYTHNGISHYREHSLQSVDGEGRANLFENGEPRGFDYRYNCENRLMNSSGFETYPARWKKPGKALEVLLPAMGGVCELKVEVKQDVVYHKDKDKSVTEEPAANYKAWMNRVQYDPEHGKNLPVVTESDPGQAPTASASPASN
jgi:hypothetical protein